MSPRRHAACHADQGSHADRDRRRNVESRTGHAGCGRHTKPFRARRNARASELPVGSAILRRRRQCRKRRAYFQHERLRRVPFQWDIGCATAAGGRPAILRRVDGFRPLETRSSDAGSDEKERHAVASFRRSPDGRSDRVPQLQWRTKVMAGRRKAYDLVVLGGGPAGLVGAATAAKFGKSVAVIEAASELGGAGINTGTVPSKTLRETALTLSGVRSRKLHGVDLS